MGLFSQREDDENTWAVLPGEPRGPQDATEVLDAASAIDPLDVGLGAKYTSIVFPVAPPAPDGARIENREPDDREDPDDQEDPAEPEEPGATEEPATPR